jgi:hypothetical protein
MAEESIDTDRLRQRVDEALQKTLDAELAGTAARGIGGNPAASFSRSVGIFFSRSYVSDALRRRGEDVQMAQKLIEMDETAFRQFADRLSTVKGIAGRQES